MSVDFPHQASNVVIKRWTGLLVAVFAASVVRVASSQEASLRGVATDAQTRRPLQGATVVLRDGDVVRYGSVTDGDGYFLLPRAMPGTYTLSVSFVGYGTHVEPLALLPGQSVALRIELVATAGELDEVLIEEAADAGLTTVAAGLQTVIPADMARVPVLGMGADLAGYLQTLPGVVSQGDRGGRLYIRGGSDDQNLALLDGVPVYLPFHIVSSYSAFPEEIVDHADVYTGGFGASYGARISSVVDVVSRNGSKQRLRGSAAIAPFVSGARIEGPLVPDHVSFIVSARQSLVEEITPRVLGQTLPYRFGDRFGKVHAFLGPRQSVSITVLDTDDRGDIAGTLKTFDGKFVPETPEDERDVSWSNTALAGTYRYMAAKRPILIEVGGGTSRSENAIGPAEAPDRKARIKSVDAHATIDIYTKLGTLGLGGRWRKTDVSYELGGRFQDLTSGADRLSEVTFFIESTHYAHRDVVRVNPGMAFYKVSDRGGPVVEPRLRLTIAPKMGSGYHEFNMAAGLYHQAVVGLGDERDVGNVFTVWLPAADSTSLPASMHVLAGWSGRFTHGFHAAIEGFVKEFKNLSVPQFSAFPGFTTSLQRADGTAFGGDVRLDVRQRPFLAGSLFDGYVSYTYMNVRYRTETFSYHPAHHRRHQLSAVAHAEKNGVGVTVQWQYGTGFPFTASGGFDKFYILTPDTDISTQPGLTRVLYGDPFAARQPPYERIDIWLDKVVDAKRARITIRAGVINVLNRDNLFYFDLFTLRRVDQMPLIPSVGLKVELI